MEGNTIKRLLFVYPAMGIGGSTTSLLSVLHNLDYGRYSVDLLLADNTGDLFDEIPSAVNILPQAIPNLKILRLWKALSPTCLRNFIKSRYLSKKFGKFIVSQQITAYDTARYSRRLQQEYDIAISFLELWATYYVCEFVKAGRKIAWIHPDYLEVGFVPNIDRPRFSKLDWIVLVSQAGKQNFTRAFPEYKDKAVCVQNILSKKAILKLSSIDSALGFTIDKNKLNISSVCRIDFNSKGLDRGVNAFRKLRDEGLCNDVRWYIIGDGPDYKSLVNMIKQYDLNDIIFLLGKKLNPYKYVIQSDLFFLPSRYEGKPMAVTEAMMLGIPALVTEYNSAREQIQDGFNGWVIVNNDHAIYEGLKSILIDKKPLEILQSNLHQYEYSGAEEMKKIYELFD